MAETEAEDAGTSRNLMNHALLKNIVSELSICLSRARVSRIHQPDAELLIFRLWNGGRNLRLLVSAKPDDCRLHLTAREWLNPRQPPRFCQLLRSRIGRIDRITLLDDDRIVLFDCHGPRGYCRLVAELTGKAANLILLDEQGTIIDVLKRVSESATQRPLLAGMEYRYPVKNPNPGPAAGEPLPPPGDGLTWNEYVDRKHTGEEGTAARQDFHRRLQQCMERQAKKLEKRLQKISQELKQQENAARLREMGELLLANLHRTPPGSGEIRVQDYFSEGQQEITIQLDSRLTPQQNAQAYFKRYKKARCGSEHSRRRMNETRQELQWLAQLAYQLDDLAAPADLETIAQELGSAGLLKGADDQHKQRTRQPSAPHEAVSPSGFRILWGRNNMQNDWLSGRHLRAGDLWFHARDCPGSHVLLKSSELPLAVATEDILYAASIAAGYSRARYNKKVEVMQADALSVRRLKGGRPGTVTVNEYKTLMVEPFRQD